MDLFCNKKKWNIPEYNIGDIRRLCSELKISEVPAMILIKRGITNTFDARWFMNNDNLYLYDPFLLCDMDKAVERIHRAISNGEKICIYGDYDVDGITSTAILYKYLKSKLACVSFYIPKRLTEGYGMNKEAIDKLCADGINLIVTVDNGITANAEIEYAKSLGIDVVVTDHHECRTELPDCCAVVNPKRPDNTYPFSCLAGVGVAFKLVCALEGENADEEFYDKYLDLAALGTIADVMPLRDENRHIVARGLKCFEKGSNIGVTTLIEEATSEKNRSLDKKVTTSTVGFTVAPRLNAAGRIGNVDKAVEILITDSYPECLTIADELCAKNRERQYIENKIFAQAVEIIEKEHDFENDRIIVACAEGWHHGVVGIVASRITEKYGLPSILISIDNGVGKGSARSIKGFNINEAIHLCDELLIRHGGHELAAGLTLEADKIDEFRKMINGISRDKISDDIIAGTIDIDAELCGSDISLELCRELSCFEPYGTSNPAPTFYMRDVKVLEVISLGQNKHTKLVLEKDGCEFEGLLFGVCPDDFLADPEQLIDILFNLDINEFRGVRTPQAVIRELRLSKQDAQMSAAAAIVMQRILDGEKPEYVPQTDLCRSVYIYLKKNPDRIRSGVNIYLLAHRISENMNIKLHPAIFGVILEIFADVGLCELVKTDDMVMRIKLLPQTGKVDIEKSAVRLRAANKQ